MRAQQPDEFGHAGLIRVIFGNSNVVGCGLASLQKPAKEIGDNAHYVYSAAKLLGTLMDPPGRITASAGLCSSDRPAGKSADNMSGAGHTNHGQSRRPRFMRDLRNHLEKLQAEAEDCALIAKLAGDRQKRLTFARLAEQLHAMAAEVEAVIAAKEKETPA